MTLCDQVRSQLLEHLYDLLDETDRRALLDHLGECSSCQVELEHVQEQMALIAGAAKEEFPNVRFVPPAKSSEVAKAAPVFATPGRVGIRWAVAAAVLLAVSLLGIPAAVYWRQQAQVAHAEDAFRQVKDDLARIDRQRLRILDDVQQVNVAFGQQVAEADNDAMRFRDDLAQLAQRYQRKIQEINAAVHAKGMDLTVVGPRVYEPGASNSFQIQTRSFRLQPMPARITVAVRDQDQREHFKKENLLSRGDLVVNLPPDLTSKPHVKLTLEVQARSEQDPQIVLDESLALAEPLYVTHLITDKPAYQPGEKVRFRSLRLERFSLRPPSEDLELVYKITKPNGEATIILHGLSQLRFAAAETPALASDKNRGLGAGEFALDRQAPPGQYTLTVSENHQRFATQECKFLVNVSDKPQQNVAGTKSPISAEKLDVEFFPEGGDLVAGVQNRVYFQAHQALDKPIELKGQIVDETGKAIASLETLRDPSHPEIRQGRGLFTFTPEAGKQYELKINQPNGIERKFPLPVAKPDGVVLSIPATVITGDEPIKAIIHNVGSDRSLLVGAYCRGQSIIQQSVHVKNGEAKEIELGPESGVGGVCRVTVFERAPDQTRGERLEPRAERLIYRSPAGRLRLNLQPDKPSYRPGEHVRIRITATDEKNQPQSAIAQVAVVDEKSLRLVPEKTDLNLNMPAHFLLMTEVRRAEPDNADFLLSADPKAAQALDLLLGTQGWRRFAEQDPGKFLKEQKEEAQRLLALEGHWPPRSVNYGQEAVRKVVQEYHREYAELKNRLTRAEHRQLLVRKTDEPEEKIKQLRDQAEQLQSERIAATARVKEAQESLTTAAGNLQGYRDFLQKVILPAALVVFLLAAAVNLTLAIVRRKQGRTIPYLAGAACSLLLVALALSQSANLGNRIHRTETEIAGVNELPDQDWMAPIRLNREFAKLAPVELADKQRQPVPVIGQAKPIGPPALENKPQAAKQDQASPPNRKNGLLPIPVPPPALSPFVVQPYVHLRSSADTNPRSETTDTLFWHPALVLQDGTAEISFDLNDSVTNYRVIVSGHSIDGRLAEQMISIPVKGPGDH